jgi:hypothetical protein
MRCLLSSIFFFAASQFDWPITPKKIETIGVDGSILKYRVPPPWPTYIGDKRKTFAKAYGIKVRCYGEHFGEHIGNLKGT